MRNNQPVTGQAYTFPEDQTLISVTDLKGRITYCNQNFVTVSGYSRDELLGQPHNIVRHPDMPEEAFRDLWATIEAGRPWTFAVQPLLLRVAARVVLPLALVVTVYIFMRGHNLPGGGFIAGLITAVALVLQYMALGQSRAEMLLRAQGGGRFVRWIGTGLAIAGLTGVGAFLFGRPFLTSAHGHPVVPLLGELPLASAALFDLGVYITVVGATLLTLSTLGSVTREGAAEPAGDLR